MEKPSSERKRLTWSKGPSARSAARRPTGMPIAAPSSTPQNISSKVTGTRSRSSERTGLLLSQERPRSKETTFWA